MTTRIPPCLINFPLLSALWAYLVRLYAIGEVSPIAYSEHWMGGRRHLQTSWQSYSQAPTGTGLDTNLPVRSLRLRTPVHFQHRARPERTLPALIGDSRTRF
jgi:hypothetical protein